MTLLLTCPVCGDLSCRTARFCETCRAPLVVDATRRKRETLEALRMHEWWLSRFTAEQIAELAAGLEAIA